MNERGFSLMEAIIATVIAVIAVVGIAYTFGIGRGQVDRYAVARAALGVGKAQMERLVQLSLGAPASDSLAIGYVSAPSPLVVNGATVGAIQWRVVAVDSPLLQDSPDFRRVTVSVSWINGARQDSLSLDRLFPLP